MSWSPGLRIARETVLTLMVNNLLDARYEPNGYTYSYYSSNALVTENGYFPMAGRNLMVGVTLRW
jgi:iron complex outermembrane receptor protein